MLIGSEDRPRVSECADLGFTVRTDKECLQRRPFRPRLSDLMFSDFIVRPLESCMGFP